MSKYEGPRYLEHRRRPRSDHFLSNTLKRVMIISVVLAAMGTLLILLIPFSNIDGPKSERLFAYFIAGAFWISIIAQIIVTLKAGSVRKCLQDRGYIKGISSGSIGVISFFRNKEAVVIDVILFASAAAVIIIIWLKETSSVLIIICLSLLFLSCNLHCIFNGKNYGYNKELKQFKKESEQDD